jgi:hypothetical protein
MIDKNRKLKNLEANGNKIKRYREFLFVKEITLMCKLVEFYSKMVSLCLPIKSI